MWRLWVGAAFTVWFAFGYVVAQWALQQRRHRKTTWTTASETDDARWIELIRSEVRISYGAGWQAGYDAALAEQAEQEELTHVPADVVADEEVF